MLNPTRAAQGVESLRASRTPPPIYAPLDPQIRAAQERQERIKALQQLETALTEMLLSARDITILSPIQVKYQNGTVLLRGLVANEADRVRAGEILLTSPYVKQVNNQMSVFEKE